MDKASDPGTDKAGRLQREAEFHDRYAAELDVTQMPVEEMFGASTALENRYILDQFGDLAGKAVLDYGCGSGEASVYFAKRGARVVGVDVSSGMLGVAQRLAKHHGVSIETRLVEEDRIPADDDEFDLVYGNGVLHHVSLDVARPELARVMKPDSRGCFIEPLTYNPVIDVYRMLADTVRTPDEHPLRFRDIDAFGAYFQGVGHREFWLTTLSVFFKFFLVDRVSPTKERYWRKIYSDAEKNEWFFGPLSKLDSRLLAKVPILGRLCWNTVITLDRPR